MRRNRKSAKTAEPIATEPKVDNRFTVGHADAIPGFQTEPEATSRTLNLTAHPEMPCFESLTHFRVKREIEKRSPNRFEAEAAVWGLSLFNPDAAAKLRTEFRREGIL